MSFQLSPGVEYKETDLTLGVRGVSTSKGAFVGPFRWGPVNKRTLISSEDQLASRFSKPADDNASSWLCAANFLAYTRALEVVRVVEDAINASSDGNGFLISNSDTYDTEITADTTNEFIAKYAGSLGNGIEIQVCNGAGFDTWDYKSSFSGAPVDSADEIHIAIVDGAGTWTGVAGTLLEKYEFLSTVAGTKDATGANIYYKDRLNSASSYVWVGGTPPADFFSAGDVYTSTLSGGSNDTTAPALEGGYDLFVNDSETDISLVITGTATQTEAQYALETLGEGRKDVVVCISPEKDDVVNAGDQVLQNVIDFKDNFNSSSYGFMDCNWKYQYDKYNDVYRWVPLNGDIAGLMANTDAVAQPWFSPAGYTRGFIKNVAKLAWNPDKTQRDELYKSNINPVVTERGEGTLLKGDKTMLSRPSAFDRVNVRRLFIVLEKAISNFAKYLMFEVNDEFTRKQFVNSVNPYLREVLGKRGIEAFMVVADETNNTAQVRQNNEFVGDIYIKPLYSINFINLNFVAVRADVSFDEVIQAA